eukprot:m.42471 g.42471  ORF g.42471 m.42471 type:complete len:82 (-) comp10693_c0_seq1:24-269(-)
MPFFYIIFSDCAAVVDYVIVCVCVVAFAMFSLRYNMHVPFKRFSPHQSRSLSISDKHTHTSLAFSNDIICLYIDISSLHMI